MKYSSIIFMAIAMFFTGQSCYKDNGNYDYIDYSRIDAITLPVPPPIVLGETMQIKASFNWKYPDRDTTNAFEFEWKQGDSVISREKDLEYIPNTTGAILIYYYVKEKSTGIVTRSMTQITVISAYRAGWLVLTENNGQSGLTYVRRDMKPDGNGIPYYEYNEFRDIHASLFPNSPLGTGPVKLSSKVFPSYSSDQLVVLQQEPVFLSGDNFSNTSVLANQFPAQTIPGGRKIIDYADGGDINIVLTDDGKLYCKKNAMPVGELLTGSFFDIPVYFEGGGANIKRMIDMPLDKTRFVYLYDDLNKRFLGLTCGFGSYSGSKLFLINTTPPPADWVDLNNLNGYMMMYAANSGSVFVNLLKDQSTGKYILQHYRAMGGFSNIMISDQQQEEFAGTNLVSGNTVYHWVENSPYLFFGEGSRLYFYDANTKLVKLYRDFESGTIKTLASDADAGELGVGLTDGSFNICSLRIDILGHPDPGSAGILFQTTNMGNIVDLTWKWGSYIDYMMRKYP